MESQRKNKFKKINHHLKSKQIDEKLELLNEIPTNNTSNYFVVQPEYITQDPDIPGEVTREVDFTKDTLTNGRDTTGLFDDDGTILTIEPPGNTSYILGPMASMWYAWGNFTTFGYIRQSDRRMVDLGRISGRLGSWNGTSGFVSYGQLTIEQARWFRDTPKLNGANNDTPNYRAFYPGPPSNSPDQYGRYLCVITGTPKPVGYKPPERRVPPVMGGPDPNLPPGSANPNRRRRGEDSFDPNEPDSGDYDGYAFIQNAETGKWEKIYYKGGEPVDRRRSDDPPRQGEPNYDAYKAGGGDAKMDQGYSKDEVIRTGKENIQRQQQQQRQAAESERLRQQNRGLTLKDFNSSAAYAAYKAGGGDAAVRSGKSVQDVINQGSANIGKYDGGSAKPTTQQPKLDKWGRQIGTPLPPGVKQDMLKGGKTQSPVGDAAIVGATALAAGLGLKGVQAGANLLSKGKPSPIGPQTPTPPGYKGPFKPGSLTGKDLQGKPLPVGPQNPTPPGYKGPFKPGSLTGKDLQGKPLNTQIQQINQLGGKGTGNFTAAKGAGASEPPKVQVNGKWVSISDPAAKGNWTAKQIWNTKTGKYETITNKDGLKWDWSQRTLNNKEFNHYTKTGEMPSGLQGWNIPKAFTPSMMQTGPTPLAGAAVKGAIGAAALDAGAAKGQVSQDIINKGNTNPDSLTNKELDAYINYLKTQSPSQSSDAKPQSFDTLNKISPEPAGVDNLINKLTNSKPGSSKESTLKKDAVKMLDKLDPSSPKYDKLLNLLSGPKGLRESFVISESRQRILREIKKPVVLPETKNEKIKHRPRVIGAPPKTINSDLMKKAEVPSSYIKPKDRLWGKYEKEKNARMSQERKNEVLDHLGGGDHAWEYMTETSRQKNQDIMYSHFGDKDKKVVRKEDVKGDVLLFISDENGKKESILQSELSIKLADEFNKEIFKKYFQEQETLQADKDPLFKKVSNRLKKEIDYPDKPSKAGYPDQPPPKTVNGWHPEYGQKDAYYNKLDPQSAESMPLTGNSQIDANVRRAKTLKKVLGKKA